MNTKELKEIYEPFFECIVVEFNVPGKTKGGIILGDKAMEERRKKMSPAMKVIAVGPNVTTVKLDEWILPSNDARFQQVPLLFRNPKEGIQHAQMHISDVLGKINTEFALAQIAEMEKEDVKETIQIS